MILVPGEMAFESNCDCNTFSRSLFSNERVFCDGKHRKPIRKIKNLPSFTLCGPFGTWGNAINWQKQHLCRYDAMKCFNVTKYALKHSLLQIEFVVKLLQRQQTALRQCFVNQIIHVNVQVIILWQLQLHDEKKNNRDFVLLGKRRQKGTTRNRTQIFVEMHLICWYQLAQIWVSLRKDFE